MTKKIMSLMLLLLTFNALAQDPAPSDDTLAFDKAKLIARANQTDGFSLPAGSILGIADIKLNNRGDVAFDVDIVGGTQNAAVWYVPNGGTGSAIYRSNIEGRLITDPGLNNKGDVVFNQFDFGVTDGVFKYDTVARSLTLVIRPENESAFSYPAINDNGTLITRVTNQENERHFKIVRAGVSSVLAREGVKDPAGKTASYLFRPVLNNNGFVVAKVRHGERGQIDESQPDSIRLWKPDGSYEDIARDIHSEPSSLFFGFDNSVGISDSKHVVFVATISGDKKGIFLYGEGKVKAVAIEGQGDLEAIENFAPVVNANGLVAFRGRLKSGKSAILTADWNAFRTVIRQGDLVPSDVETAKIYDLSDNQGFIGGLSINNSGVIAFHAGILSKDGERFLGQGIYLLSTATPPAQR